MATKKGIILTAGILIVITAASFLIWIIPQNNEIFFVISNFDTNLNGIKEIHQTLSTTIEEEFKNMLNKKITPDEYIEIAEITSSQINSELIKLVESDPPEEWYDSYFNYVEALKKFNTYVRETIVLANLIKNQGEEQDIQDLLKTINDLNDDSKSLSLASDEARP